MENICQSTRTDKKATSQRGGVPPGRPQTAPWRRLLSLWSPPHYTPLLLLARRGNCELHSHASRPQQLHLQQSQHHDCRRRRGVLQAAILRKRLHAGGCGVGQSQRGGLQRARDRKRSVFSPAQVSGKKRNGPDGARW